MEGAAISIFMVMRREKEPIFLRTVCPFHPFWGSTALRMEESKALQAVKSIPIALIAPVAPALRCAGVDKLSRLRSPAKFWHDV